MTALNKQALTDETARESGNILLIVAARLARRELFTPLHFVSELPKKVVSMRVLREALERSEETLQREVCKIVDGHDRMAKKLKEAESKLEAAEKRIAELEARKFKVEMPDSFYPDGDIDVPLVVDELEVIAAIVEAGGKPVAFCKRCDCEIDLTHRPDGSHYCHAPAAGIGVKGE
ncbi:hypothetical protein KJB16_002595 [Salmonella enterica]|nr:hypothetical protein [Salmonella enterica]EDT6533244.1 hypothetical protein [Salmonella enterica subsp. enterica]EKQ4547448.1 hypothetical protein [Salmonella enterica subsp. enterica serovar Ruiru]EHN5647539.1 hypothetical protein [Salmonella enterica]EHN5665052.1 hypothetical protein [Salmonella enterica]